MLELAVGGARATLAGKPNRVRLVVDDAHAKYPLVIDPILTAADDGRLESDQAGARLGWSAAGAGDVNGDGFADVIVAAYLYDAGENDEGAAFVFHDASRSGGRVGDFAPLLVDPEVVEFVRRCGWRPPRRPPPSAATRS